MNIFPLGQIVATPAALEAIQGQRPNPRSSLNKHGGGDWGDVGEDDAASTIKALLDGERLLSAYRTLKGVTIWIISEATDDDGIRNSTTILLPEQY